MENDIWTILAAYLQKEDISLAEKEKIEDWLKESDENRHIYKQLKLFVASRPVVDPDKWEKLDIAWLDNRRRLKKRQKSNRRRLYRRWEYAALFILLCGIAISILYLSVEMDRINPEYPQKTICFGTSQAILTLASGEKIDLRERDRLTIQEKCGIIRNEKNILTYTPLDSGRHLSVVYNRLEIPRGGEYKLILEDGSMVWLNSETKLRFPVVFGEGERRIYLEGEAYFQVKQEKNRPFIVCVGGMDVTVLGTEFNISTLVREGEVHTTLVKGSVKISREGMASTLMKPSEQAIYRAGSKNIQVRRVNTLLYTSWKDGFYTFEQQELEDIMNTLARWYNIQVIFGNESIRHLRFSGRLKRYENIDHLLEMIQLTNDVDFVIKGETITVINK